MAVAPAPTERPASPPDERFWQKHSPNQEFPISSLTSIALHVAAAVTLVFLFNFIINTRSDSSMPVELFEGNADAGGGGEPNATGNIGTAGTGRVERATEEEIPKNAPIPNISMGAVPDVLRDLPDLPHNPEANRELDAAEAKNKLNRVAKSGTGGKSVGQGGPGSGGGSGSGHGTGSGPGTQPGTPGSIRQNRNRRWTLSFSTISGNDYLRQLNALGAILVAEYPDGNKQMYRQLGRSPVPAEPIDPELSNKMRWVDERPNFVAELSHAMGLERTPNFIKAYFPFKLENELLKLELAYRNRKEEEIDTTTFRVFLEGDRYRLVVSEQKYLK